MAERVGSAASNAGVDSTNTKRVDSQKGESNSMPSGSGTFFTFESDHLIKSSLASAQGSHHDENSFDQSSKAAEDELPALKKLVIANSIAGKLNEMAVGKYEHGFLQSLLLLQLICRRRRRLRKRKSC